MTNKIACFIGNSHLVCVKEALEDERSVFAGKPNFFYAPGHALRAVQVADGHISAASEYANKLLADRNESITLPLEKQDMFVVVGLQLGLRICTFIWDRFRLWDHQEAKTTLLSRGALKAAIAGTIRSTIAYGIADQLRKNTDKPIVLVAQPSPLEAIMSMPKAGDPLESEHRRVRRQRALRSAARWKPFLDEKGGRDVNQVFVETLHMVARQEGFIALEQSPETMNHVFTSSRFRRVERPDDVVHTSKLYGLEVLGQLANRCGLLRNSPSHLSGQE